MAKKRGLVHLYTGNGEGKTATAFGVALRSVGHGHKVMIIQFMKGRKDIGEYKIMKRLAPEYEIHQFGREEFVNLKHPSEQDKRLAQEGFEFAKKAIKREPDLLILEEINLAIAIGLLKLSDVLNLLNKIPNETTVILTGRRANKRLMQKADLVTTFKMIKHPLYKGVPAREGIEY